MEEQNRQELEKRAPIFEVQAPAAGGYGPDMDDSPRGGLLDYWRMIQRRKGTVLLAAFLGALAAVLYTLPQTPIYQARTTLEVQDINSSSANLRAYAPEYESVYNTIADIQTQIKIFQSNALLERAMAKMKVKKAGDLKQPATRVSVWRKALNLPEPAPQDLQEAAIQAARGGISVRAAGQTRIIELTCDSTDPKIAAEFANVVASEYIEQNIEARWKMAQRTGDWLGKQLDDMRIKLERSEDALQTYARQNGLMFMGSSTGDGRNGQNVSEEKLRQLQQSLSAAQTDRVAKQSKWEVVRTASPETLPDVLNDSSLREYQTKLTDLRRQEAELSTTYQPEYAKVKRIRAQIAPLEAALERERKAITSRIKNEYDEAMGRERMLSADYAKQVRLVTGDSEKAIQYNILKREVDSNRQIYDAMLQKVKESSVTSAMRASNIRVVDPAKVPGGPYKPNVRQNGMMGLLAGMCLGVAFVVMRERADRSLQEPGDAAFYLNVPELGVVPAGAEKSRLMGYYYGRKLKPAQEDIENERMELVTWQRKPSMVAESFRVALTSILFSGKNGSRPRVLTLTSAGPAEGKTTVACNLGIALAEIKQRVLLVDCDLRKPRMHAVFDLPNERGLSDLLQERPLREESLSGVVHETKIPGLFVLPSGPATSAASNLLHSASLPELLEKFRKEFDMVLIDTPPMLQMPDARVVGRLTDAVIIVLRAGKTTRDAALAARSRFAEDETRVMGTILNDWNPNAAPGGYYGYYSGKDYRTGYGG